jgi:hypothetical protein
MSLADLISAEPGKPTAKKKTQAQLAAEKLAALEGPGAISKPLVVSNLTNSLIAAEPTTTKATTVAPPPAAPAPAPAPITTTAAEPTTTQQTAAPVKTQAQKDAEEIAKLPTMNWSQVYTMSIMGTAEQKTAAKAELARREAATATPSPDTQLASLQAAEPQPTVTPTQTTSTNEFQTGGDRTGVNVGGPDPTVNPFERQPTEGPIATAGTGTQSGDAVVVPGEPVDQQAAAQRREQERLAAERVEMEAARRRVEETKARRTALQGQLATDLQAIEGFTREDILNSATINAILDKYKAEGDGDLFQKATKAINDREEALFLEEIKPLGFNSREDYNASIEILKGIGISDPSFTTNSEVVAGAMAFRKALNDAGFTDEELNAFSQAGIYNIGIKDGVITKTPEQVINQITGYKITEASKAFPGIDKTHILNMMSDGLIRPSDSIENISAKIEESLSGVEAALGGLLNREQIIGLLNSGAFILGNDPAASAAAIQSSMMDPLIAGLKGKYPQSVEDIQALVDSGAITFNMTPEEAEAKLQEIFNARGQKVNPVIGANGEGLNIDDKAKFEEWRTALQADPNAILNLEGASPELLAALEQYKAGEEYRDLLAGKKAPEEKSFRDRLAERYPTFPADLLEEMLFEGDITEDMDMEKIGHILAKRLKKKEGQEVKKDPEDITKDAEDSDDTGPFDGPFDEKPLRLSLQALGLSQGDIDQLMEALKTGGWAAFDAMANLMITNRNVIDREIAEELRRQAGFITRADIDILLGQQADILASITADLAGLDLTAERLVREENIRTRFEQEREKLGRLFALDPAGLNSGRAYMAYENMAIAEISAINDLEAEIAQRTVKLRQDNVNLVTNTLVQIGGLRLGEDQLTEESRQFDRTFGLNEEQLRETARQFDDTMRQRIEEFGKQFGLDKQQIEAVIRQIDNEILNQTRGLSAEISQRWAELTGLTGTPTPMGAGDLGVTISAKDRTAAILGEPEALTSASASALRASFEAAHGRAPTNAEVLSLMKGNQVTVEGGMTLEGRKLATAISQQEKERVAKYSAIAREHKIEEDRFNQAVVESDREWQLATQDIAEIVGIDENLFTRIKMKYDDLIRGDSDLGVDGISASKAISILSGQFPEISISDLSRAITLHEERIGIDSRSKALQLGIAEATWETAKNQAADQESRFTTMWDSILAGAPEKTWGKDTKTFVDGKETIIEGQNITWTDMQNPDHEWHDVLSIMTDVGDGLKESVRAQALSDGATEEEAEAQAISAVTNIITSTDEEILNNRSLDRIRRFIEIRFGPQNGRQFSNTVRNLFIASGTPGSADHPSGVFIPTDSKGNRVSIEDMSEEDLRAWRRRLESLPSTTDAEAAAKAEPFKFKVKFLKEDWITQMKDDDKALLFALWNGMAYSPERAGGSFWEQLGSGVGAVATAVGVGLATKSDRRLKEGINLIGRSPSGLNIYEFSYKYRVGIFRGVMSDEVPEDAVIHGHFDMVDYSKIDVDFERIG